MCTMCTSSSGLMCILSCRPLSCWRSGTAQSRSLTQSCLEGNPGHSCVICQMQILKTH